MTELNEDSTLFHDLIDLCRGEGVSQPVLRVGSIDIFHNSLSCLHEQHGNLPDLGLIELWKSAHMRGHSRGMRRCTLWSAVNASPWAKPATPAIEVSQDCF